jgi:long-chain acyl-CoA synthetase
MLKHLGVVASIAAEKFDDREALVFNDRSFTFAELGDLVERTATGLVQAGVKPGDVVTLYGGNHWKWIVSYYAIARAGAVINPINTMLTPEEVRFVVEDCKASVIIASDDKIEGAQAVLDTVNMAFTFGDNPPDGMQSFDTLLNSAAPTLPSIDIKPESLSTICYTSGTTGHPKGAMQSHRAVILNGAMTAQMQMRGANDVVVSALPCPHVYSNVIMQSMMLYGCKLILHERFDAGMMLADIQRYKATMIDGVPTMYMYLLNHPDIDSTDLSCMTRAYVGGQTMPKSTMEAVEAKFGVPLIELWGMTEIAGLGTTHPLYGDNKHGSIGCALPYCSIRICDTQDPYKVLETGQVGELQLHGPITMMGYFNDEQKTKETLLPDGWLRTGDLAKMDEDGCGYIVDRLKDMILTGGFNIYPAEIERVLAAHPAVSIGAVGKKADALKGEIAKAYIVLKEGITITKDEINAFCRERLAAYKCPREIQFVNDVPKTSTGKIMRRELYTLDD